MNKSILKAALLAARQRILDYNKVQRMRSVIGQGRTVDKRTDCAILDKIDATLEELET